MSQNLAFAPLLTERDEAESAEGGIDPLGLYIIADALGVKLIPGIRERQTHPRFLTALAVSLDLCSEFEEEVVATDGASEPWLVLEWHVVEGIVRSSESGETVGLPGSLKTARAIADRVPLSGPRYLKTPSTGLSVGIAVMIQTVTATHDRVMAGLTQDLPARAVPGGTAASHDARASSFTGDKAATRRRWQSRHMYRPDAHIAIILLR